MPQTLSVIKAGVGGYVGRSAVHPEVHEAAREHLAQAVQGGLLIDGQAHTCGSHVFLLMSHERGEDDQDVHRLAWDTLTAAAEVAGKLKLYGAGHGLLADAFPGNMRAAGAGAAEMVLTERPSEPVVVFLAAGGSAGAFNLPLARAFADPFTTPGLVLADALHAGFAFEVHDVREQRKVMFSTPDELHDLLAHVGSPRRYAVKRVVSKTSGEVAAVASTEQQARVAGRAAGGDDPTAIVRCEGGFPSLGEILEPFAAPTLVEGGLRGSHVAPSMPVALGDAHAVRGDGPPRVVALGYQLANGLLVGPRDLFADVAFDGARRQASELADVLRRQGPFEPHRAALDEMEQLLPSITEKMTNRWSAI